MKYFLYHESYNTKIEGPYMACQCACIKNIIDVHANKSAYFLDHTPKLYIPLVHRSTNLFWTNKSKL